MTDLPYINTEVPRIVGEIKQTPEDFVVEEIPLYELSGTGEHVYIKVMRRGMTTQELIQTLARELHLNPRDVGYAGLKDKQAQTTQWLSFQMNEEQEQSLRELREDACPWQILECRRHGNKLKRGHLKGNRFEIRVRTSDPEALSKSRAIADLLLKKGLPNYFGEQRFGNRGDNASQGRELLQRGHPARGWRDRLLLSAYQAGLFNRWLAGRIIAGHFGQLIAGDVAKKTDTGGLFVIEELEVEQARYDAGEIRYTGPIYGFKMKEASADEGLIEARILHEESLDEAAFRRMRLSGSRRIGPLDLDNLQITAEEEALHFQFTLPKGSYATAVMREFLNE